jgi:hypothetical protein
MAPAVNAPSRVRNLEQLGVLHLNTQGIRRLTAADFRVLRRLMAA